jgi:hypothetical protein
MRKLLILLFLLGIAVVIPNFLKSAKPNMTINSIIRPSITETITPTAPVISISPTVTKTPTPTLTIRKIRSRTTDTNESDN